MAEPACNETVSRILQLVFEETFEKQNGLYLDEGTSLLETLDALTAAQASIPLIEGGTTIAAHVIHLRYYISLFESAMRGDTVGEGDWPGSWAKRTVDEAEWKRLKSEVRDDYLRVSKLWSEIESWDDFRQLRRAFGIIIHTAFHLGAIRQMMKIAARS